MNKKPVAYPPHACPQANPSIQRVTPAVQVGFGGSVVQVGGIGETPVQVSKQLWNEFVPSVIEEKRHFNQKLMTISHPPHGCPQVKPSTHRVTPGVQVGSGLSVEQNGGTGETPVQVS